MEFSKMIGERRAVLGISQQNLADYSGVSLRMIKGIETSSANPSIAPLRNITEVLGLELILKVKEAGDESSFYCRSQKKFS
ncbi:MAG: helix-turn-helix domain-containing protein [Rikenellaceae bacterium]